MITIYHNPRCTKSREGLKTLENLGCKFEVREYLKQPLSEKELKNLLGKLNMSPMELVRTEEKIWKENYRERDLTDDELIRVMTENPKLIQRPIVEKDEKAVVGRPTKNIEDLLN
ncbi:arsenate reductase (glutaredoxin) [Salinimicrobium oceani]|uniref:Arsenate reductase (Glutaredoxin) n=1 Tax=Salinimicrobium oceani TaxID=2722702 RepID=A0ABX1D116_9FLAO|nr:arsenate reductase (glutaredoxin) [Salinimicrobium oceani]NJW52546.1 arsenate reductase (glutaredoxin) [Salinimicrobium oceani]